MEIIAGNHDEAVMSLVNDTPYPSDLKDKFYEDDSQSIDDVHKTYLLNHLDMAYHSLKT